MKPARSVSGVKPPGALSVETLGGITTNTTSTTSSQVGSGGEKLKDFEVLTGPSSSGGTKPPLRAEHKRAGPVRTAKPVTRVLVADDSPAIRAMLTRVLEEAGYEVVLASNSQEANEKFTGGGIDLVLLDLGLQNQTGWSAFEEMVALKEDQAIILMTDPLAEVDVKTTGHLARVVEKPINVSMLLATIRRTLADPLTSRRSALASQQDLARYAKPYLSPHLAVESYEHWGLND